MADQRTPDALPLALGQHANRTEHLHVDESRRSVEPVTGEQHMTNDLVPITRNQGKAGIAVQRRSQVRDKCGYDATMLDPPMLPKR
jgi:hypothetical protein